MEFRQKIADIVAGAKRRIDESVVTEDYPQGFSLEEFAALMSFNRRVAYCKDRLQRLGTGSSRIAYAVDDTKVLKIAKNAKGVAQNIAEFENTPPLDYGYGSIFAQPINHDENGLWLEQERAEPVRAAALRKVVGLSWKEIDDIIWCITKKYKQVWYSPDKKWYDLYCEHHDTGDEIETKYEKQFDFIYDLDEYFSNYQPEMDGDFHAARNWGIVTRNGEKCLVVIDNGLTNSIFDKFYNSHRRRF